MTIVSTQSAAHYTWGDRCDGWHLLRNENASVIQERMPPGTSEVAHFHERSRQFFYVLAGQLSIVLDGVLHEIPTEHGCEVSPNVVHRVFNAADSEARFLVISVPPSHSDRTNV